MGEDSISSSEVCKDFATKIINESRTDVHIKQTIHNVLGPIFVKVRENFANMFKEYQPAQIGIRAEQQTSLANFIKLTEDKGGINQCMDADKLAADVKASFMAVPLGEHIIDTEALYILRVYKYCYKMFFSVRRLEYKTRIHVQNHFASERVKLQHHEYKLILPVRLPAYKQIYIHHPNPMEGEKTKKNLNSNINEEMERFDNDMKSQLHLSKLTALTHIETVDITPIVREARKFIQNVITESISKRFEGHKKEFNTFLNAKMMHAISVDAVEKIDEQIGITCSHFTDTMDIYNFLFTPL